MDFRQIVRNHLSPMVIAREPEIVDELALHLSDLYREGLSEGLGHDGALAPIAAPTVPTCSPARSSRPAVHSPGLIVDRWRAHDDGLSAAQEGTRWSVLSDLRRDIRYAVRMLARTPGFTFVVCLTLALGIGANAVIFTAVDAIMLRSAPVADPDSVVSIYTSSSDGRDRFSTSGARRAMKVNPSIALRAA